MINITEFELQAQELSKGKTMPFELAPDQAFTLVSMVQAAVMCLPLPPNVTSFGRNFVDAFCDRYRGELPHVVKSIEQSWALQLSLDDDEFEGVFSVAPQGVDPETYDY